MKKLYTLSALLFLIAFQLSAQNISTQTIQWNSPSWLEPDTGNGLQQLTTIISSPGNITWKNPGDSVIHSIAVRSSSGTWSNVTNNGSMMFGGDSGNDSAVVEFKKTNDRTFIRIIIVRPDEVLTYVIDVTSTTTL